MGDALGLTRAFLERQPGAAADVIDDLEPADAAALLASMPARLAGPVVNRMTAWTAARAVAAIELEQAAGIVRAIVYRDAVSLLRLIEPGRVEALLQQLPRRLARDFRRSLEYPIKVVGAWMDQSIPSFALDDTAGDGMKYLGRRDAPALSHLFVVDRESTFAGTVGVNELLQAAAGTRLAELLQSDVRPLSNRDLLTSVVGHERWDRHLVLPVVGHRRNVLGGLTRQALRQGLDTLARDPTPLRSNALFAQLFTGYFVACAGLLRVALPPLPPESEGE